MEVTITMGKIQNTVVALDCFSGRVKNWPKRGMRIKPPPAEKSPLIKPATNPIIAFLKKFFILILFSV